MTAREWKAGFAWASLSVLAQTAANVFAKQAARESLDAGFMAMLLNPWNVLQLAALASQAFCWVMCLRKFSLSVAYPLTSVVVGLNLFCAWVFFNEAVALQHLLGAGLIMSGVILIGSRAQA